MPHIHVVVTMDVEPTTATSDRIASGPPDLEFSEKSIRGYEKIARDFGIPGTYFVHPEIAVGQPDLLKELEENGACLGLHLHPWKFSRWRYDGKRYMAHFGGLSENEQRAVLSEAIALWQHALGRHPLYFRPGTYSANDNVYKVLAELGFRGGSVSDPGRIFPELHSIWTGAELDPHRAHACFRQAKGDLDFANMPLSVDTSELVQRPDEFGRAKMMYRDLRPDWDWGVDYKSTATNIVNQIRKRNPSVPVINLMSHNQYDYTDSTDPTCQRLVVALKAIHDACREFGLSPVGTTLEEICGLVLNEPPAAGKMVLR